MANRHRRLVLEALTLGVLSDGLLVLVRLVLRERHRHAHSDKRAPTKRGDQQAAEEAQAGRAVSL